MHIDVFYMYEETIAEKMCIFRERHVVNMYKKSKNHNRYDANNNLQEVKNINNKRVITPSTNFIYLNLILHSTDYYDQKKNHDKIIKNH